VTFVVTDIAKCNIKPKFHLARHVTSRHNSYDVSIASRRASQAMMFDKLDTAKMHGNTRRTCRVMSRCDVTSQVFFGLKQSMISSIFMISLIAQNKIILRYHFENMRVKELLS